MNCEKCGSGLAMCTCKEEFLKELHETSQNLNKELDKAIELIDEAIAENKKIRQHLEKVA